MKLSKNNFLEIVECSRATLRFLSAGLKGMHISRHLQSCTNLFKRSSFLKGTIEIREIIGVAKL